MKSLLAVWMLVPAVFASSGGGTVEFPFIRNFVTARNAGFANTWVPGGQGISALGHNPAGLARSKAPLLDVGGRLHTDYTNSVQVGGSWKAFDGVAAARLDHQTVPEITGIDGNGDTTGALYNPSQSSLLLGFGEPLGERLSWGIGARLIREDLDIDGSQAFGVTVHLGAVLQPGSKRFLWWAQMEDLGTKLSGHTEIEREYGPLPLAFAGGLRYTTRLRGLNVFAEARKPMENDVNLRTGFEYRANRWIEVRGAFRTDAPEMMEVFRMHVLQRDIEDEPPSQDLRWSLGGTLRHEQFAIDYAFQWWSLLDPAHYVNVSWDFSLPGDGTASGSEP
jgi:hypothetical protein